MTCSIVARDPATGQLGVGVMSCYFAVGATVPWARAGCGAVATQAFAEPAYGPRCLDTMATGATADEALASAGAADPMPALRQVGVVAADGTTAAVTGDLCVDHAGKHHGDGYVVVANMMAAPDVWADAPRRRSRRRPARSRTGSWWHSRRLRPPAATRGAMSASLLVVDGDPTGPSAGQRVDVRVDASADPIGDLRRLLDAAHAYATFDQAAPGTVGRTPRCRPRPRRRCARHAARRRRPALPPRRARSPPPASATAPSPSFPPLGGRAPVVGRGHPGLRREGSGDAAGRSDVLRRQRGPANLVAHVLGQDFGNRFGRLAEIVDIVRRLAGGGGHAHSGRYYQFPAVRTTHEATPFPIVFGGLSDAAVRRAARLGDGWYGVPGLDVERVGRGPRDRRPRARWARGL